MEAKAQARFVRVTPQKARRVVDLIRGKQAEQAVATLKFAPQAAGETVLKVVESAIANARVKADRANVAFDASTLVDLDRGPLVEQQRDNYEQTAALTQAIRSSAPSTGMA